MKKAKILVVEDQNIVALNIRNKLKNLGYTVTGTASTGEEAIRKADLSNADLVLMDIMLKGEMDGIEAAREIKNKAKKILDTVSIEGLTLGGHKVLALDKTVG